MRDIQSRRRALFGVGLAMLAAGTACNDSRPALVRLIDARRLTMEVRVELSHAADASNRAVMADTDEISVTYAKEAELARQALHRDADTLGQLLTGLGYAEESKALADFATRFAAYETLDRTVLELAVENTNLKARHLSFGPCRDAANAFRAALEALSRGTPAKLACSVASDVAAAVIAVREIQFLQAPHIAEADDVAMTAMEKQMADLETAARASLVSLSRALPASPDLAAARDALDRFAALHKQLIMLSRRNTNVRSFAMALGQRPPLVAACEASLAAIAEGLAKRGSTATR